MRSQMNLLFAIPDLLTDGNLGSRAETSLLCQQQNLYGELACQDAQMFLSYFGDAIADFNVNMSWPIYGPTGQLIASNYSILLSGASLNLVNAVVLAPGQVWWSGSTVVSSPARLPLTKRLRPERHP